MNWGLRNLNLSLGYTDERFHEAYWQTDSLQPINDPSTISGLALPGRGTDPTVQHNTFLATPPFQNYEGHIFGVGLTYTF